MSRTSLFRAYSHPRSTLDVHVTIEHDRLSELLELRRLRKSRQGIDVHKLSSGDAKKRRRRDAEETLEEKGGLTMGAGAGAGAGAEDE